MTEDSNQAPHSNSTLYEEIEGQPQANTNTLKRNPKMELSKTELLRLLSYMEGELQAQSIVIAVLKSERAKQEVNMGRYRPQLKYNPYFALARDSIAEMGTSRLPFVTEMEMRGLCDRHLNVLDNLFVQQRLMQMKMTNILKEAEEKHHKVIHELEEEKAKHEHDTAQGDDITYGLEMERTRLKQELEFEKQAKKRSEKDQKRFQESVEDERMHLKQIILYLLAEGKKTHLRYVEERKRSEDLAQILSEEKARVDAMAEGLEEESKKSLRMEAELEKQIQVFDKERAVLKAELSTYQQRVKDLESELSLHRNAAKQNNVLTNESSSSDAASDGNISSQALVNLEATGMPSSVAKVMQPTSTVSSVPVSGPTTGIAQTIQSYMTAKTSVYNNAPRAVNPPQAQQAVAAVTVASEAATTTSAQPITSAIQRYLKARGAPPPIPPNKPIVPPKRDGKLNSVVNPSTVTPQVAAVASSTVVSADPAIWPPLKSKQMKLSSSKD